MGRINLQLVGGFFYPTDHVSREILADGLRLDRIPIGRFDYVSPRLVKDGHKLAITGYDCPPRLENRIAGQKIGGVPRPQINPCSKCYMDKYCNKDMCTRFV